MNSTNYSGHVQEWLYEGLYKYEDSRTTVWPLLAGGPTTIIAIVSVYVLLVKVVGPRFMRDRKAYDLRGPMMVYNGINILWNLFLVCYGLWVSGAGRDLWGCRGNDWTAKVIFLVLYGYLLNKLFDFFDTFFFVLRKKESQVTFLHVTHHWIMPITSYYAVKYAPNGNSAHTVVINSFIHVIMYLYYLLASLGPQMQPYLWWKKYITTIQMVQFAVGFSHGLHSLLVPNCHYPKVMLLLEIIESFYFFVVFFMFYVKSYRQKRKHD